MPYSSIGGVTIRTHAHDNPHNVATVAERMRSCNGRTRHPRGCVVRHLLTPPFGLLATLKRAAGATNVRVLHLGQ